MNKNIKNIKAIPEPPDEISSMNKSRVGLLKYANPHPCSMGTFFSMAIFSQFLNRKI